MTIYTPRGLKIRMEMSDSFALMSKLYPDTKPYEILKTTEGFEHFPKALMVLSVIFGFIFNASNFVIFSLAAIIPILGMLVIISGLFIIPGVELLGRSYTYISGFGVILAVVILVGYITSGWQAVAAFILGRVAAFVLRQILEFTYMYINEITLSELSFFSAYVYHANKLGKDPGLNLSEEDKRAKNWEECLEQFARNWPEVASRFR